MEKHLELVHAHGGSFTQPSPAHELSKPDLIENRTNAELCAEVDRRILSGRISISDFKNIHAIPDDIADPLADPAAYRAGFSSDTGSPCAKSPPKSPQKKATNMSWTIQDPTMGVLTKIFLTIDDPGSCHIAQCLSGGVMCLILVSISCLVLASMEAFQYHPALCDELMAAGEPLTVDACQWTPLPVFDQIEVWVIALFTLEYIPRLLLVHQVTYKQAGLKSRCSNGLSQTWRYATQPMNMIDFLSIAPFYLELLEVNTGGGLAVLRVLRLMRVFRIMKVGKFNKGLNMLQEVWYRTKPAAGLLLFFNIIFVIFFAGE
jgi:hypothetical protein